MPNSITCIAAHSRGVTHDFEWQSKEGAKSEAPRAAALLGDEQPSLVLERMENGTFQLLVDGLDAGRFDRTETREVHNGILFSAADESVARSLAAAFLRNWNGCASSIAPFVTADPGAQFGWRWDPAAIANYAESLLPPQPRPDVSAPLLVGRRQGEYGGPESTTWLRLADELENNRLPLTVGTLVVVAAFPAREGRERAEQAALRLHYRGAVDADLDSLKKKTPDISSASSGSSASSRPSSRPAVGTPAIGSSPSPFWKGSWLIYAGLIVLAAVIWKAVPSKKKTPELEPAPRPAQTPAVPDSSEKKAEPSATATPIPSARPAKPPDVQN